MSEQDVLLRYFIILNTPNRIPMHNLVQPLSHVGVGIFVVVFRLVVAQEEVQRCHLHLQAERPCDEQRTGRVHLLW